QRAHPLRQSSHPIPFMHFVAAFLTSPPFRCSTSSSDVTLTKRAPTLPLSTFRTWTSTFLVPGRLDTIVLPTLSRLLVLPPRSIRAPRYLSPDTPAGMASIVTMRLS